MKKRKGKEDKAEVYIRKTKAFPEVLRRLLFVSWVNLLHTQELLRTEASETEFAFLRDPTYISGIGISCDDRWIFTTKEWGIPSKHR